MVISSPVRATTATQEQFRSEVRDWLRQVLPSDWGPHRRPAKMLADRMAQGKTWQRTVYEGGFGGLGLPVAYGGRPASATERLIFAEECARARAPEPADIFGQFIHYFFCRHNHRFGDQRQFEIDTLIAIDPGIATAVSYQRVNHSHITT